MEEKCEFCALLNQLSGESTVKTISKNESFVVLGCMEGNKQGIIVVSTFHKDLNIKDQEERIRLTRSIGIGVGKLMGRKIKIVPCSEKAKHYHLKIFPK
jgi:hypothetical protein